MAHKGFLLIADITGYTMFLTSSELEHAQGVLDALFKSSGSFRWTRAPPAAAGKLELAA